MKGSRVQSVVQELKGEKIDIVNFDEDPARFVCDAIAPAEVSKVILHDKDHSMEIVVPDDQLSLAIGKRGQNVSLAARLTGCRIDIKCESKVAEVEIQEFASYDGTEVQEEPSQNPDPEQPDTVVEELTE